MTEQECPSEAGQYVKWLTGGPTMYIRALLARPDAGATAACVWFSPDDHYHAVEIPVSELHLVNQPQARVVAG